MATYVFTIGGSTKTVQEGWTIDEVANGLNRLSAQIYSSSGSYRPAADDNIIVTENGTRIFGGLIEVPSETSARGAVSKSSLWHTVQAVSYKIYASRAYLTADIAAGNLKAALTVVATALSAYGVTLDAGQANGPTLPALSYNNRLIAEVLDELCALASDTGSTSYVWDLDYSKVLSAFATDSVAAPFNISNNDGNTLGAISIEQPRSSDYANYIRLYGGTGLKDESDTFTGDGATTTFALNYTFYSSSRGVVNVAGVDETFGGTWTYDASANTITRTSGAPALGAAITFEYVGVFPRVVISDGGVAAASRVERVYTAPEVFDATVLQQMADSFLTRDMASPKRVTYAAAFSKTGLHPGQHQTIANTKHNLSGDHLIEGVRIVGVGPRRARRLVTAVTSLRLPATTREKVKQALGGSSSTTAAVSITTLATSGVSGSGTAGNLAAWASSSTLGDTGLNYTGTRLINIGAAPAYEWYESDQGSNAKRWRMIASSGAMVLEKDNDTAGSPTTLLSVNRSGEFTTGIWKATAVGAQWGGTGLNTAASSGIPSVNAGTWQVNNVLTANRVLLAGSSNAVSSSAGLTYSGTTLTIDNTITTPAATNLTLSPTGDIVLGPSGLDVLPNTGYTVNLGALTNKFLTLHAAELWVETLVAQNTIATIGGRVIVAPTNILTADLSAGATTITVKYNNFANGDRIYLEANGAVEWMAVTSSAGGSSGAYTYSVTRNLDGSGANAWTAGDAAVNTGTTGNGFIDLYSVAGVLSGSGPTIVGNVRTGTTYNNIAARWAIGNLNGLYDVGLTTYGVAFGDPSATNVIIDATAGFRIRSGTTNRLAADTSGNLSLTGDLVMSTSGAFRAGATAFSTGTGWWLDYNSGTPRFRVGNPSGNYLSWDGTNLNMHAATVNLDSNGIHIDVPPTAITASYGFDFKTAFSGTSFDGLYGYENGATRELYVYNATNQASKTIYASLMASDLTNSKSARIYAKVDSGAVTADAYVTVTGGIHLQSDDGTYTAYLDMDGRTTVKTAQDGVFYVNYTGPNAANTQILFLRAGVTQGSITSTGGTTAYNTSSDRRLKADVRPTARGLSDLLRVAVRDFTMIADPHRRTRTGFIAQELNDVYADAVSVPAEDDAPWQVDYGRLTPLLVSAVQELAARVVALEGGCR